MAAITILTDKFVGPHRKMAGLQIRTYEMARALIRRGHQVTIAAVNDIPEDANCGEITLVGIESLGRSATPDVWISHPLLMESAYKRLKEIPLVIDGYEFPFASFYAHTAAQQRRAGDQAIYAYHSWVVQYISALSRADRVVCATEAQRIGYLSLLAAVGRINPKYSNEDILLTVCSGAPPEDHGRKAPMANGTDELSVLWAGGCYPWFDIQTYGHALDHIVKEVPEARFVFAGLGGVDLGFDSKDVYPDVTWLKEYVSKNARLASRSTFLDWVPYDQRGGLYNASVGVCTHHAGMESTFAMRTRVIDMIWGGLPTVCTGDDFMSVYIQKNDIGVQVACGDVPNLAGKIIELLRNPQRRHKMSQRARSIAQNALSWDMQILPLHEFCANPAVDSTRGDPVIAGTLGKTFQQSAAYRSEMQNNFMRLVGAFQRRWHEINK